jgi:sugar phosphate permease
MMDKATEKKYNYWQWRTLITLMIGYALYYFVRKHFSVVMPALESELGISKVQLGLFLTLNGIIYGLSRFVNGFLADRFSRRKLMTAGLVLSALTNLAICFSPLMNSFVQVLDSEGKATLTLIYIIGSLWVLNGYFQGMGVPPCMSLMSHWIKPSELATKQSIWNASHSIGAGLISVLCGFLLKHFGYSAWQLCFAVPAAIAIVGAIALFFTLKDTPSSVGLPEIEEMEREEKAGSEADCEDANADGSGMAFGTAGSGVTGSGVAREVAGPDGGKARAAETALTGKAFKTYVHKMVFANPLIWILAVSNFCIYVVRFTILDWGTTFLTQYKHLDISTSGSIVAVSELLGGIAGMLLAGWFTDRFMHSKAHRTCFICSIGATLSFFLFWKSPEGMTWLSAALLCLSSFFIYGPQALLGAAASQQATKHACATANGILGIFGYASTTISGVTFGYLADHWGWDSVFLVSVIIGLVGALVIALMWNAPADGYAKAEAIMKEAE